MPLSLTTFTDATAITASDIRSKIEDIEKYINEDLVAGDLKTSSPWVTSSHVFKPEFFRTPSPRVEMVSGDTWYRFTGVGVDNFTPYHPYAISGKYLPIPGAACTVRNPLSTPVDFDVTALVYAMTIEGFDSGAVYTDPYEQKTAEIQLMLDGARINGTRRFLYAANRFTGTMDPTLEGQDPITMMGRGTLTPGTHHIYAAIKLEAATFDGGNATGSDPDWVHTFISTRSLIVETYHLE